MRFFSQLNVFSRLCLGVWYTTSSWIVVECFSVWYGSVHLPLELLDLFPGSFLLHLCLVQCALGKEWCCICFCDAAANTKLALCTIGLFHLAQPSQMLVEIILLLYLVVVVYFINDIYMNHYMRKGRVIAADALFPWASQAPWELLSCLAHPCLSLPVWWTAQWSSKGHVWSLNTLGLALLSSLQLFRPVRGKC